MASSLAMRELPLFQVDAFTRRPFAGNPAAVCPLETWLPDALMQSIAAENNLSETAFFTKRGDAFDLRWFTPVAEVDLCGHATLATAFVLMTILEPSRREATFHSKSGPLRVTRGDDVDATPRFVLDFPSRPPAPTSAFPTLADALGAVPRALLLARDLVAVFDTAADVRALAPDFRKLAAIGAYGFIATAAGGGVDADVDFVSRFFVPGQGIDEDPVTGSAHCTLIPFWSARLGKRELKARQVSARGGELSCVDAGDRVEIGGTAVLVMRGTLFV